ncbi:hypothetical protein HanXRQr2_Chr13g0619441 [Helianthus annuus]|uniref:Uncharacterized protein n=1 Tax=Helianthus annuus TaxID=4232 RepID=A0A9K3EN79_HELAN|nr:hypothetical protein HanXRQr2_Chr13g0619441 [Helianthus annuus]KAJ0851662.1 hypothetical protein HanPSC8_Chr13g0594641 [Helianthus annuus]
MFQQKVYDDVDDARNLVGCLETHLNFNTCSVSTCCILFQKM